MRCFKHFIKKGFLEKEENINGNKRRLLFSRHLSICTWLLKELVDFIICFPGNKAFIACSNQLYLEQFWREITCKFSKLGQLNEKRR